MWLAGVVMITAALNAPVKPLMDAAVMSMLEDKSDYGRSRLYGQLGFGLGSWFVGPFLSADMKYIFIAQALIAVPTALLMLTFKPKPQAGNNQSVEKKKEDLHIGAALKHVVTDPKFLVFYFVVFIIGVSSGIIENFAYVRLSEIISAGNHGGDKGTGHVLGICRMVSSIAGGPMFWLSGKVTKAIGVNGVLTASLCSYVMRFMIYASVQNPWHALPAEAMRGSTFAVFWAGCTYYVYNSSPTGLTATMVRTIIHSLFHVNTSLASYVFSCVRDACRMQTFPHSFLPPSFVPHSTEESVYDSTNSFYLSLLLQLSLLSGVYAGVGQSAGALIGGALCKRHGISKSFYICGAVDLVLLLMFGLYQLNLPDGHHHHIPETPISEQQVKKPWWQFGRGKSNKSKASAASKQVNSNSNSINNSNGKSSNNGDNDAKSKPKANGSAKKADEPAAAKKPKKI